MNPNLNLLSTSEQQPWLLAFQSATDADDDADAAVAAVKIICFDEDDLLLRRILDDALDSETYTDTEADPLDHKDVVSPLRLQLQRQRSEESFFTNQSQSSTRRLFAVTDERFRLLRQESEPSVLARRLLVVQQKRRGGIIHDSTPADAAEKRKEGTKVRRSRHGHGHGEQKGTTRRELTWEDARREKAVAPTATTTTTVNEAYDINETRQKSLHRKKEKIRHKHQQRSQSRPPSEVLIREGRAPAPRHHQLPLSTPEKVWITFDQEYRAPRNTDTCTTTKNQKHISEAPQQHQAIFSNDDNFVERHLEKQKEKRTRRKSLKNRSNSKEEPRQTRKLERQKHQRSSSATRGPTKDIFRKNHEGLASQFQLQLERPMKEISCKHQLKERAKKSYGNHQRLSISEIREELMKNQQDIRHRISDSLRSSSHWLVDGTEEDPPHVPIRNHVLQDSRTELTIVDQIQMDFDTIIQRADYKVQVQTQKRRESAVNLLEEEIKTTIETVDNAIVDTKPSAKVAMSCISSTFRPSPETISAAALMNQTQLNETENISISIGNLSSTKRLQAEGSSSTITALSTPNASLLSIQVNEIKIDGRFNSQPSMRLSEYEDDRTIDTNQSDGFPNCATLIPLHKRALYSIGQKIGEMDLH